MLLQNDDFVEARWGELPIHAPAAGKGNRSGHRHRSGRILDLLGDAPTNSRGIDDREIAQSPRPVFGRLRDDAVLHGDVILLDLLPPGVDVLYEKVHLQVVGKLLHVMLL